MTFTFFKKQPYDKLISTSFGFFLFSFVEHIHSVICFTEILKLKRHTFTF